MIERVWITGSSGLVGRSLCQSMAARRPEYVVLTTTSREVDLRDADAVKHYLSEVKPTAIIHAAGRVGGIRANISQPTAFLYDNMAMGMNLIYASAEAGVSAFLNIGSSCMYPKDYAEVLREDDLMRAPLEPTNEGYALAKLASDRLCEYLTRERGVAYRTVIPSNLYGPFDHFDEDRGHLVASAIRKVYGSLNDGRGVVSIWGDGSARREFTFARDVTDFIVDALPRIESLPQRMNLGCGVDYSVSEFYMTIARILGFSGDFSYDESQPVGMRRKLMDSSLARANGWNPSTDLDSGLSETIDFYREWVAN